MTKKKWHMFAIVLGMVVIALSIGGSCFWQFRLKPWILVEETRSDMRVIGVGISEFLEDKNRMPTDLKEIVQSGYLPDHSSAYWSPLLHNSLRDESILYVNCEYNIRFDANQVVVSLPDSVIDRFHLNTAPSYSFECRVDSSGNVCSP